MASSLTALDGASGGHACSQRVRARCVGARRAWQLANKPGTGEDDQPTPTEWETLQARGRVQMWPHLT